MVSRFIQLQGGRVQLQRGLVASLRTRNQCNHTGLAHRRPHTRGLTLRGCLLSWISELISSLHLCFISEVRWVSGVCSWAYLPSCLPPPLPIPRIGAQLPSTPCQVVSTSASVLGRTLGAGTQRTRRSSTCSVPSHQAATGFGIHPTKIPVSKRTWH